MQKGYIYQTNSAWHVRYRVDGKQVSRKLADLQRPISHEA